MKALRLLFRGAAAVVLGLAATAVMADAGQLRGKYTELRDQLRSNPYHRPIHIDSAEQGDTLKGDVYAVLDRPYAELRKSLADPNDWCAILILPFNTKYCHPSQNGNATTLALRIGRKADQPTQDAYPISFHLQPVASNDQFFESRLTAAEGPVGTRDYRITLEAVPLDNSRRTFMHLSYAYAYGGMGRMAMQAYLSTAGANKVGFSVEGREASGQPVYIGGVRGAIERNVMRYYLAIDAHLASLNAPPEQQLDRRLQAWFDSTEQYARQLHEMDRAQYMALKRGEWNRAQAKLEDRDFARPSARLAE